MKPPNTSNNIEVSVIHPLERFYEDKTFTPHRDAITYALMKIGYNPEYTFYLPSHLMDYSNNPPTIDSVSGQKLLRSDFILFDYSPTGTRGLSSLPLIQSTTINNFIYHDRGESNIPRRPFVIGFTESKNNSPEGVRFDFFVSANGLDTSSHNSSNTIPSLLSKTISSILLV